MNLQEQKLALAAKFPQVLRSHPPSILIFWRDTGQEVTDREWLEVAWRLELRLDADQRVNYGKALAAMTINSIEFNSYSSITAGELARVANATALQRLEALCRVLWPERFQ